jgi:hypothetical protein
MTLGWLGTHYKVDVVNVRITARTMSLHTDGYEIRKDWFPISPEFTEQVNITLNKAASPIFNGPRNDGRRRQATFPLKYARSLHEKLSCTFPDHTVGGFVALESLPDCGRQAAHSDYVPTNELLKTRDESVPLLAILALEPHTYLDVWPSSHRIIRGSPIFRKTLTLEPGDIVIFRADLIHAGSAYSRRNIRLHAYLDHEAVPRVPNRTWVVHQHGSSELYAYIKEALPLSLVSSQPRSQL